MLDLFSILLSVAIAAQAAFASPIKVRTDYAVKETHTVPRRWASAGRAPSNHMLHLQIGLKQDRFEELERHLHESRFSLCSPVTTSINPSSQSPILIIRGMASILPPKRCTNLLNPQTKP